MASITVSFDHPEADDSALARATVVGTSAAGILVQPGGEVEIDLAPSDYAVFVAVTDRTGTAWSVGVTATGGDSQTKKGKGPDTVMFSHVSVKEDE